MMKTIESRAHAYLADRWFDENDTAHSAGYECYVKGATEQYAIDMKFFKWLLLNHWSWSETRQCWYTGFKNINQGITDDQIWKIYQNDINGGNNDSTKSE